MSKRGDKTLVSKSTNSLQTANEIVSHNKSWSHVFTRDRRCQSMLNACIQQSRVLFHERSPSDLLVLLGCTRTCSACAFVSFLWFECEVVLELLTLKWTQSEGARLPDAVLLVFIVVASENLSVRNANIRRTPILNSSNLNM